jgi:hypothetical protein
VYENMFGMATTAVTIVAAHLLLWPQRLSLVWRYTIGICCIGAGISVTAAQRRDKELAVTFWAMAGAAGATTAVLHKWREERGSPAGEQQAYIRAGRVAGRASRNGTE